MENLGANIEHPQEDNQAGAPVSPTTSHSEMPGAVTGSVSAPATTETPPFDLPLLDTRNVTFRRHQRGGGFQRRDRGAEEAAARFTYQIVSGQNDDVPVYNWFPKDNPNAFNTSIYNEGTTHHSFLQLEQRPPTVQWPTGNQVPPRQYNPSTGLNTSVQSWSPFGVYTNVAPETSVSAQSRPPFGVDTSVAPDTGSDAGEARLRERMAELSIQLEELVARNRAQNNPTLPTTSQHAPIGTGERYVQQPLLQTTAAGQMPHSSAQQFVTQTVSQHQATARVQATHVPQTGATRVTSQQQVFIAQPQQTVASNQQQQHASQQNAPPPIYYQQPQFAPQYIQHQQHAPSHGTPQHFHAPKISFPSMKKDNIEMWFIQIDRWFRTYHITTQLDKFDRVVSVLDGDQMIQLYQAVAHAPAGREFDHLKEAITRNYASSEQKRIQKLIAGFKLGDYKPSQLLNIIRNESSAIYSEDSPFIKQIWMNSLPDHVKVAMTAVTAVAPDTPLHTLADAADKAMEQAGSLRVDVVSIPPPKHTPEAKGNNEMRDLRKLLETINARVQKLETQGRSRSKSPSKPNQGRGRSKSPKRESDASKCWYHNRFGDKAKLCAEGCRLNNGSLPLGNAKQKND